MKTFCYSKAQHKPEKSLRPETEEWLNNTSQAKHSRLLSKRCIKLRRRATKHPSQHTGGRSVRHPHRPGCWEEYRLPDTHRHTLRGYPNL